MPAKRYPLPKRLSIGLSEQAYANLRELNQRYHFGNNYLLTILLENIELIADKEKIDRVFSSFAEEFGAPSPGSMKKK
ncbi:MAG: hypothetical protein KJP16_02645 [Gammaproteobacteria bacterium]|nr:hypothetical protein [Gammaproteobacteria bacterium]NNL49690.1 hypothetical protein [Woeseiaceae bacterium]